MNSGGSNDIVVTGLKDNYVKCFFEKINSRTGQYNNQGNKLRTYAKIKFHYKLENYLTSKLSRNMTVEMAKLRTSTHNLLIETGRYCRPVIPSSERKCKMCASRAIEDEIHFVVQCTAYTEMRKRLLKNVADTKGTDLQKFVEIMTTSDEDVLLMLGKFLLECCHKRKTSQNIQLV